MMMLILNDVNANDVDTDNHDHRDDNKLLPYLPTLRMYTKYHTIPTIVLNGYDKTIDSKLCIIANK